jgi:hypothetical protein
MYAGVPIAEPMRVNVEPLAEGGRRVRSSESENPFARSTSLATFLLLTAYQIPSQIVFGDWTDSWQHMLFTTPAITRRTPFSFEVSKIKSTICATRDFLPVLVRNEVVDRGITVVQVPYPG